MTTTILSSRQRFGKQLVRGLRGNISTAVYMFVMLFIFFPLQMAMETQREIAYLNKNQMLFWQDITGPSLMYTSLSSFIVPVILIAGALVIGLIQCSYLHNKRAVDLYHSIPLTRPQLMCSGMLTSFCTLAVPFLLNYAITLAVSAYRISALGGFDVERAGIPVGEVFWDILGWLVTIFCIVAVVNFVATQVGSVFENFIFSVEVLLAPVVLLFVNQYVFSQMLVGYPGQYSAELFSAVTPAFMVGKFIENTSDPFYKWITLVWLLLGAAIFFAALILYRRRRSEIAETSGCRGALGIIFCVAVVYIGSPIASSIIFGGLGGAYYVIGVLMGSALIFLLFEAVMNRGFAGLRRKLPLGIGICAFVTAIALILTTGGLGYETRVPATQSINSVELNYRGWYGYVEEIDMETPVVIKDNDNGAVTLYSPKSDVTLTTPESVDMVRTLHEQLITAAIPNETDSYFTDRKIRYELGLFDLLRHYSISTDQADATLLMLENTAEFQQMTNPVLRVDRSLISGIALHDNLGFFDNELTDAEEINLLMEALSKDALEHGSVPFEGGEKVVCYLYITTPRVYTNYNYYNIIADKKTKAVDGNTPAKNHINSFSVPVFASYANTISQLGVKMPKAASVDEVTEMGGSEYYHEYNNARDRFVSVALSHKYAVNSKYSYSDYYTSDSNAIGYVMENMITTSRNMERYTSSGYPQLYCTFHKGDEQGITVMIQIESSENLLYNVFPEMRSYKDP